MTMGIGNAHNQASQFAIALIVNAHARQGIILMGIEARGDQDELWFKGICRRE